LRLELSTPSPVCLRIYDVKGRLVREIMRSDLPAGRHDVSWDGLTSAGVPAETGIYFVRLKAGQRGYSTKILVLR
jgi:flagellar hook assembly protein FlgD